MNYQNLLDRLFDKYGDNLGFIRGEPVQVIYIISKTAEQHGYRSEVDTDLLTRLLAKASISPPPIQSTISMQKGLLL